MSIDDYLESVCQYVNKTDFLYKGILRKNVITHPIPFFGQIEQARILTVGVNPSAQEFRKKRLWPQSITTHDLSQRLRHYFSGSSVASHPWFKTWQIVAQMLNHSYAENNVAHLDLSPRATKAMGQADRRLFRDMIIEDIRCFFDILPLCCNAKLMMIAGTVASSYRISKCIQQEAPKHGFELQGDVVKDGKCSVSHHKLVGQNVKLPVFFCSSGPSYELGKCLIERAEQNKEILLSYLV